LISLAILFYFLCAQYISNINISIIRSLRLFCWITTLVVLFLVRCVLEFRCGWVGVVSVLQASAWSNADTTPNHSHQNSNTHRTKSNTTSVVIQQNSRKLLIMDILIFETYWAHKKWNKITSDIKLVFYSSKCVTFVWVSCGIISYQNRYTNLLEFGTYKRSGEVKKQTVWGCPVLRCMQISRVVNIFMQISSLLFIP